MAKRLWIAVVIAAAMMSACKSSSSKKSDPASNIGNGDATRTASLATDPVERALLNLGIDGGVSTLDLNQADYREGRIVAAHLHLLRETLLVEGSKPQPRVLGIDRGALSPAWVSSLPEPSLYPVGANADAAVFVSKHYVTPVRLRDGLRTLRFGADGAQRPPIELPFTPTAGAAVQHDSAYVPSLGSSVNNKKLESFSRLTGQRGWGWRAQGDILTSPLVGGSSGDPKLYFVTNRGIATCLDARNYGFGPDTPRWEQRLAAGVGSRHHPFLTRDTADMVGGMFIVDRKGTIYCIDRITGRRRWANSTGRTPAAGPQVFGNLCIVKMSSGFVAYDRDNVLYRATVVAGASNGASIDLRNGGPMTVGSASDADLTINDAKTQKIHLTFRVEGEILTVVATDDGEMRVDGADVGKRTTVENGSDIRIGTSTIQIEDRGALALWSDLKADRIVCRVGNKLVVAKGNALRAIDAYTGEPTSDWVAIPGMRLCPSNTHDANLAVLVGDARLYTLFPR